MLSHPDRALVQRDQLIPGLAHVLDTGRLGAVLTTTLPDAGIERVTVEYLRYKPGSNCLARFSAFAGGQPVMGYAKAYGSDAGVKLEKASLRPTVPSPFGPGRVLLEDLGIEISFFPNDSKLPALARLADRDERARVLSRLLSRCGGSGKAKLFTLRYKPQRRYVACVKDGNGNRALVKVYTSRGYQQAKDAARNIGSRDTLKVPDRLGSIDRRRMIAYEWLPGSVLTDFIRNGAVDRPIVERVGAALAELHGQPGTGLNRQNPGEVQGHCRDALESVAWTLPGLERMAGEIADRLAFSLDGEDALRVPVHGDFYAQQVLVNRNRISIVDLDNVVLGNPTSDLGLFLAHLELGVIDGAVRRAALEEIRAGLLDGYSSIRHAPDERWIDLHTASGLAQLAPHHFRNRVEDWHLRTSATLERACQLIERAGAGAGRLELAGSGRSC